MQLANEIPGFAGYYIESGSGQLVAFVKDTGSALTRAAGILAAHLAQDGMGLPAFARPHGVRIRQADYDFQTLSDYRDFICDSILGAIPGVVMVALDARINRVAVGIVGSGVASARTEMLTRLQRQSIPIAAIDIVLMDAPRQAATSASKKVMPPSLDSTMMIQEAPNPDTLAAGFAWALNADTSKKCTIGAVVDSGSVRMFLSASHCSTQIFHLDHDSVATPNGSGVGAERDDPNGTGTCGTNCVSRDADAALYSFSSNHLNRKGVIARPGTRAAGGTGISRDTTIDSVHPWLFITSTVAAGDVPAGTVVEKIGMRSGWTYGTLTYPCATYTLLLDGGNTAKVWCEGVSSGLLIRQGDSGGPVFIWDGYDGAVLVGDVSALDGTAVTYNGGDGPVYESDGSSFSYFSAAEGVLGTLDALNNTTVSAPSLTGDVSGGTANASWSAPSTTNTTAATVYQIWEWTWDASTQSWDENEQFIGTTSTLFYSDVSAPWTMVSVAGSGQPDMCNYSSVGIEIRAYNQGAYAYSGTLWFQGPKNGSGPAC